MARKPFESVAIKFHVGRLMFPFHPAQPASQPSKTICPSRASQSFACTLTWRMRDPSVHPSLLLAALIHTHRSLVLFDLAVLCFGLWIGSRASRPGNLTEEKCKMETIVYNCNHEAVLKRSCHVSALLFLHSSCRLNESFPFFQCSISNLLHRYGPVA